MQNFCAQTQSRPASPQPFYCAFRQKSPKDKALKNFTFANQTFRYGKVSKSSPPGAIASALNAPMPQCPNPPMASRKLKAKPLFEKPQKLRNTDGKPTCGQNTGGGKTQTANSNRQPQKKRIPGIGILSIRHSKTAKIWGGKPQSRRHRRNCHRPNSKLRRSREP